MARFRSAHTAAKAGYMNMYAPDIGELSAPRERMTATAYCSSHQCNGASNRKYGMPVMFGDAARGTQCPFCKGPVYITDYLNPRELERAKLLHKSKFGRLKK